MGRPREFDREQALQTAQSLFWTHGYEGTSMADLVAALGIASARIYAAFGSKEALFREATALYVDGEGSFVARALDEEPTAGAAIARLLREAAMLYSRDDHPRGCMVVGSAVNCSPANAHVGDALRLLRLRQTDRLIAKLREAALAGEELPDIDPAILGDLYATILHGLSVQARDGVSRQRLLALAETAASFLKRTPA